MAKLLGWVPRLVLACIAVMIAWMPSRLRLWLGAGLGFVLSRAGFRKRIVEQNVKRVFPDFSDAQADSLVHQAYTHLGSLLLEMLLLFGPFRAFCKRNVSLTGVEHWNQAKAQGKGVLFLSSHVGNWELMAGGGAANEGIDILLVTKVLKPAWLHEAIEQGRLSAGVRGTYEPKTFRDVLTHLRAGGTVGVVLDQYTGPPVGVRVPFFGTPVGTHTVLAMLAKRTGAPVLPVTNHRGRDGKIRVEIGAPIIWRTDPDSHREIALNTAAYTERVEGFVRAYPSQWLWTHRRFKGELGPLMQDEWTRARTRS